MSESYTMHVGEKFNADGSTRPFPGVTIICFADPASAIYRAGEALQAELRALSYAHKFALLPPPSFHMTVFSLICDYRRIPEEWSSRLPLDAPLAQADQFFIDTVAQVPPPSNFRMLLTFLGGWGLSMRLTPADQDSYKSLRTYRQQIAAATGVRYPDHDTYEFHLSLAYKLITLTDDERRHYADLRRAWGDDLRCQIGVFDTGKPILTFFEDMFAFVPAEQRFSLPSRR
ncbi:MAG: DUF1868 domain-containing protein [Chloroflexi bacterium]|nr:DUF1868 domain-containing protein [Chloroflexota bacterium]